MLIFAHGKQTLAFRVHTLAKQPDSFKPRFIAHVKESVVYTLIKSITPKALVIEQLPALVISIVIAETFYKFHSFTLECLAFLATWFVIDLLAGSLLRRPANK